MKVPLKKTAITSFLHLYKQHYVIHFLFSVSRLEICPSLQTALLYPVLLNTWALNHYSFQHLLKEAPNNLFVSD